MPARDLIHDAVKNALIKDGWTMTTDPYELAYQEVSLVVDLAAEKRKKLYQGSANKGGIRQSQ